MGRKKLLAGFRACALSLALLLPPVTVSQASNDTITLTLGKGSIFRLERSFATVLIGDPRVVDVRAQDDRSVILKALGRGSSNIVFVDAQSIAIVNIKVIVLDARI
ncbi:pilus assembly protein N-terminal domain-containing protein [Bradyrhizobium sp. Tv2a-2]|uniref:pilus assembly protein N-terminal domain-containing protein n=1 Tax=Bradyrhizobium sp. Tv2a-2 TaxID=113395 RepID=UPI0005611C39|nr:pilus assembly protein N-terminal domain-containing protein [Bradyrhizobium sp. Tv2a-2]